MKKKLLSAVLFALSMVTVIAFSSCGGGNDDDEYNTEEDTPGVLGYKYVEPCLKWHATTSEVASYMATIPNWKLSTEGSTDKAQTYTLLSPLTNIIYTFDLATGMSGLCCIIVTYYSNKDSELADLINRIESTYNCKLTRTKDTDKIMYEVENVVINGYKTDIAVLSFTSGGVGAMSVNYSVSD